MDELEKMMMAKGGGANKPNPEAMKKPEVNGNSSNKGVKRMSGGRLDIFQINLRHPIDASWKIGGWMVVGIPICVGFIWGIRDPDNLFSILGVSARRAAVSTIVETQPIGQKTMETITGKTVEADSLEFDVAPPELNRRQDPAELPAGQ